MADPKSTVALNIGSQRVAMATFSPGKGGKLVLNKYASQSILADPVLDATRMPKVQTAIAQLSSAVKAPKSTIRYAISGQPVITRFVKLPPLDDDNVKQIVTFEAQQVIPIPLEQIVWDYKMMESSGIEKEVALIAIKEEQLDEIHDAVEGADLKSSEVDVAPMALYNAFRYNYPDVAEPTLLIDIGAKVTNLIYIEGDRFFVRTANIAGASVTSTIAKQYNVGFADAEAQKVSNGLVALGGGHTSQLDEATAALAMSIRNVLSKLPAEVARTTNLYRSQHGGNAPVRVMLAGGGANLPYTKEFFEEKLNLPVEFFNPLQRVTLGKGVDADQLATEAHLMGELVGLAIRPLGKAPVMIDLVPDVVEDQREESRRRPIVIASAAVLILALGFWASSQNKSAGLAEQRLADITAELGAQDGPANSIKASEKKEAALNAKINAFHKAEVIGRNEWLRILTALTNASTSEYAWITEVSPLAGYNPLSPKPEKNSVIVSNFDSTDLGRSFSAKLTGNKAKPVNAIRITGFWRDNPEESLIIQNMLKNLRDNAELDGCFSFESAPVVVSKRRNSRAKTPAVSELTDDKLIVNIAPKSKGDAYAWPFELIIPLKNQIPLN